MKVDLDEIAAHLEAAGIEPADSTDPFVACLAETLGGSPNAVRAAPYILGRVLQRVEVAAIEVVPVEDRDTVVREYEKAKAIFEEVQSSFGQDALARKIAESVHAEMTALAAEETAHRLK